MRSSVPSRITNAFPHGHLDRRAQSWGECGEDLDRLVDVAEYRGRADPVPGSEVGVGLALAQVSHGEQRLLANG
jgi:hypothetical protein